MIKNYLLSLTNSVKEYYTGSSAFDKALQRNSRLLRKFHDRIYTCAILHTQQGGLPSEIQKALDGIKEADNKKTQMLKDILDIREGESATVKLLGNLTENIEITKLLMQYLAELRKFVKDEKVDEMMHQLEEIDKMMQNMLSE